jgi:N-acetyl-gamma-glutamyl-phosphate reductase
LGLAPALAAGLVENTDIVSVLTVGTSGAGRGATEKLFEIEPTGSADAYQVGGIHRHTPEIEQNLSKSAGANVQVNFTPVLASIERGILAVNTAVLKPGVDLEKIRIRIGLCGGAVRQDFCQRRIPKHGTHHR